MKKKCIMTVLISALLSATVLTGCQGKTEVDVLDESTTETYSVNYEDDSYDDYDSIDDNLEDETEETTTNAPTNTTKKTIANPSSAYRFSASGSGDSVATGLEVENYAILNITTSGNDSNIIVKSHSEDGDTDLLVNKIGEYTGTVLIEGTGKYKLEVKCGGSWNISGRKLAINDKSSFSGKGDSVTGITTHSGDTWKVTHDGESNIIVKEYGVNSTYPDLLVNEIGNYSGTVMSSVNDDAVFFEIKADGNWTIEKQ